MGESPGKNEMISLYLSGMSIPQVSEETGFHRSTVRYHLNKEGVLRSRGDGVRLAASKGRIGAGFRGKTRTFTKDHCMAISKSKRKHGERTAKELSLKPSGYLEYTRGPNKGRGQHRVVMESVLGRELRHDEHVHHIDGDRANNDPSNLQVLTISAHMSLHASERAKTRRRNTDGTWC